MTERHPIQVSPSLSLEQRARLLEVRLAQLWDQVWWMRLPWWRRLGYRVQGFQDPIEHFYEE